MGKLVTLADRRPPPSAPSAAPASLPSIEALRAKLDGQETELAHHLSELDRGIADLLRRREAICGTLGELRASLVALDHLASGLRRLP